MISMQVKGMTCQHCVRAVETAIGAVDDNAKVKIDLACGRVEVVSDAQRDAIVAAIVAEGYEVAAG